MKSSRPRPLDYANLPAAQPWSPWPMMFVSTVYGVAVTGAAYVCDLNFRQIFSDFKVDLPMPSIAVLSLCHLIWSDHAWMVLIPACALWPLLIPLVPAPQLPESRRVIIRTLRLLVFFIFLFTGIMIAVAIFAPMIALMHSASGPQKP
jgi:hypothetical protein